MPRGTSDSAKGKRSRIRAGKVREQLVTEVKAAFRNTAEDPSGDQAPAQVPADLKLGTAPLAETSMLAEPEAPPTAPAVDPLPARMLNEFVYCPRLFYYEYVEGVFVDNADTTRGAALHARVDKGSGALPVAEAPAAEPDDGEENKTPKPGTEPEKIHSRSVTLGSDRLGVIAKLDLVEVRSNDADPDLLSPLQFCPVDYKAGAPREGDDGNELWPTDRMQLGLQILILRDNGYRCERGIIYYRATKQRVALEWTSELETWVLSQIESARKTMEGPIPPPLVASPKCLRCSLNSVCLPDETRLLATGAVESSVSRSVESEGEASRTPAPEMISAGLSTLNSQLSTINQRRPAASDISA